MNLVTERVYQEKKMSSTKQKSLDSRRSPVNTSKSGKTKPPKTKVSKTTPAKPVSNGFHEVSNGVDKRKDQPAKAKEEDEVAKMNLLTLQKVDKSVAGIVETVPHVVLYEFKPVVNMWVSWKY